MVEPVVTTVPPMVTGAEMPIAPLPAAGSLALLTPAGEVRPLEELESEIIRFAISHYRGQMSEVARRLKIGRSTLYRKLEDIGAGAQPAPEDARAESIVAGAPQLRPDSEPLNRCRPVTDKAANAWQKLCGLLCANCVRRLCSQFVVSGRRASCCRRVIV